MVVVLVFFSIFIDVIFWGLILLKLLWSCLFIIIKGFLELLKFVLLCNIILGDEVGFFEVREIFKLGIEFDKVWEGLVYIFLFNIWGLIVEMEFVSLDCDILLL